jgi:hypothetical protein
VSRDKHIECFFACEENQTIDFNHGGVPVGFAEGPDPKGDLIVKFAVYGALPGGDRSNAKTIVAKGFLQGLLNKNPIVVCNNETFQNDPASGNLKHFAAMVHRGGRDFAFACAEGQTINFENGGS